jgi:glyoxylase-like metal-dependent hydrolase (beta-lactamase superfamily II)
MDLYGQPIPVPERRMSAVGKEMHLDLGNGVTATLLHSPGHAPHQISVMLDRSKSLLTADAVGVVYPNMKILIPTTPPPSLDPKLLVETVNRLSQMDPQRLLVPHFGLREDPESVFERTKERMSAWVDEIGAMKKKGLSFDEITNQMVEEVRRELDGGDMPIYAKVLVRTSTMGIAHYLDKNL